MLDVREVTSSSLVSSTSEKPRNHNGYGVFCAVWNRLFYAHFCAVSGQNFCGSGQISGQKNKGPPGCRSPPKT